VAVDALDFYCGPNFSIELRVAVHVLDVMAVNAVHSLLQMDIHQMDGGLMLTLFELLGRGLKLKRFAAVAIAMQVSML
jgi:hypothetical protein